MSDGSEGGFTLLEITCVLALIAMMAAVLLPFIPHNTSRSGLQAYALQAATLLKADRNAAIRRGVDVATLVDDVETVIGRGNPQAVHSHDI
jgi:general secretion pathway protein H